MNEVHWVYFDNVNNKAISGERFRFVEYEEIINQNIKPFKK